MFYYIFVSAVLWAATVSEWPGWSIPRFSPGADTVAVKPCHGLEITDSLRAALIAAGVDTVDIMDVDSARVRAAAWGEE